MRVVFFGTPDFAATILSYLVEKPVEIVGVVSRPDKARGRSGKPYPTEVKQVALEHHLPLFQPTKASSPEFVETLKGLNADLFIVAAYAEILRENVLEIPPLGCINVHGSLLPKYRGAAPVQRVLMAGERETGVSIMKMVLEMDAGAVYTMVRIPIPEEMTAGELFDEMAQVGARTLWEVMQKLERGEIEATPQDHAAATFTKKVKPEEGEIDWGRPADVIHNQVRGLTPNPGAYCWVEVRGARKRMKVKRTRVAKGESEGGLVVPCSEGALELLEVQLEGKKVMSAGDFLRGISISDLKFL